MEKEMVSPFLLRPLRSLQEFLRTRRHKPDDRAPPVERAAARQFGSQPACNDQRDAYP